MVKQIGQNKTYDGMLQKQRRSSDAAACIHRPRKRTHRRWFMLCSHYLGQLKSVYTVNFA